MNRAVSIALIRDVVNTLNWCEKADGSFDDDNYITFTYEAFCKSWETKFVGEGVSFTKEAGKKNAKEFVYDADNPKIPFLDYLAEFAKG